MIRKEAEEISNKVDKGLFPGEEYKESVPDGFGGLEYGYTSLQSPTMYPSMEAGYLLRDAALIDYPTPRLKIYAPEKETSDSTMPSCGLTSDDGGSTSNTASPKNPNRPE